VGKLLRVVNSSMFGLSRGVSDLNQALALLGTKSVRLLVLGFSLPDELFAGLAGDTLRRYWHYTALKATAAREISETIYRFPGEEAFIAALLQDLGMLVLMQQLGEPYLRFLDRAFANALDVHAAEAVTLGFDHVQLTARLLQSWGLPESLVMAIGVGNSPDRMSQLPSVQRALPQILHLADLLAGMLAEGRGDWLGELLRVGQNYRQLSGAILTALVEPLQEKTIQMAEVLSLELPAGLDYQRIFAEAHHRLIEAADDAAVELAITRRSDAIPTGDDEADLLSDTESLKSAVQRFSQQPQKSGPHTSTRTGNLTASSTAAVVVDPELSAAARANKSGVAPSSFATSAAEPIDSDKTFSSAARESDVVWIDLTQANKPSGDGLLAQLTLEVAACRKARCPLSLMVLEIDRYNELLAKIGPQEAARLVQFVGLICGQLELPRMAQLRTSENRIAIVLPDYDRSAAVEAAYRVLDAVRRLNHRQPAAARAQLSVSLGVATAPMPAKNFAPHLLLESANRCLHAAQVPSGNAVKSIDVL
jgi:GGDEF domain-containing protein